MLLGIGNEYRHDDGVGLIVVRHLKAKALPHVIAIESREGLTALEACHKADFVIVADAVVSGVEPGTICRLQAHVEPLPRQVFRGSTHTFGVAEVIALARALNQLPRRLIVYGIEGKNFAPRTGLSEAVEKAVPEAIARIVQEIVELDIGQEADADAHAPKCDLGEGEV